jgi:hypothetical protein
MRIGFEHEFDLGDLTSTYGNVLAHVRENSSGGLSVEILNVEIPRLGPQDLKADLSRVGRIDLERRAIEEFRKILRLRDVEPDDFGRPA